ncbi:unnamed protein product [Dicrocoelium dendriticum]|nr:unnamed protein product [Dicrocoelium dendriticum]
MARLTKVLPKSRFLAALSFVYLFAFSSIYIQLPGLYGDNGIYPARLTNHAPLANLSDFYGDPDLLRLSPFLKLDTFQMLELCVLIGIVFSFLAAFCESFRTLPVYLFLWLAYFSILKVGQTFLWFQWDLLLVEAGFLALLLAKVAPGFSFSFTSGDRISIWLLRWLLFRLMFSAGVVKLRSNCPAWWSLQALHWHYQSQCIPTPLAWYFHHLPGWFHSLSVASTFIIEILVPLLFFVPLKPVRLFCFYSQVLLQVFIILTGNYNFFNLLTIALCYSLLTDDDFHSNGYQQFVDYGPLPIHAPCTGADYHTARVLCLYSIKSILGLSWCDDWLSAGDLCYPQTPPSFTDSPCLLPHSNVPCLPILRE